MAQYDTDPYNHNEDIGYNYLGDTGGTVTMGNGFWRFLFEPFVTFEEPRDPKTGSLWRGAKKLLISNSLELVGVFLLCLSVVSAVGGAFKAGLNISLIGLLAGVVHGGMRYAICSWRHTPYLQRNLSPTFTAGRLFHGTKGLVWALVEMAVQYTGAALAALAVDGLALGVGDSWRGVGKFGEAVELGDAAAWALISVALFVFVFVDLFNQTTETRKFSYGDRENQVNSTIAWCIVGISTLSIHYGVFSNNALIAFTGGLVADSLSSTGSMKWGLLFIFCPLTASLLASGLKKLLWNVNDIPKELIEEAKSRDRLNSNEGGVQHNMDDRKEVSSDMNKTRAQPNSNVDNMIYGKKNKKN